MAALIRCDSCGKVIEKSAGVCKYCGAVQKKKKKKHPILTILVVLLAIGIIGSALGGDKDDGPKKVGDTSTSQSKQDKPDKSEQEDKSAAPEGSDASEKDTFGVGEQVNLNDVIVTLNGVTESTGKQFFEPDEGNVYILCEFTIENNSKKELNISSILCFDGYVDDYSTSMSITAQTSSDKNQLDGTIAAGKKMNGVIGYEAAADWKEIEIHFTPDFWKNKEIVFVTSK